MVEIPILEIMMGWFKKKPIGPPLQVDFHSHLLPGLDDGVKTLEESLSILSALETLGFKKAITTPHIMSDAYKNNKENILQKLSEVRLGIQQQQLSITLEAAAEYYLDEWLFNALDKNEPLLTFGKGHLLFETNFIVEPLNLNEFIFSASTKGYTLVMAHPERYLYLQHGMEKAEDLINRGVLFQINVASLIGQYSKSAQKTAERLIDKGWVHGLGSDCHHSGQLPMIKKAMGSSYYRKALSLPLLNHLFV